MCGPCAKRSVKATFVSPSGLQYIGTNSCRNPQGFCPRLPGEGYEKCKTICAQAAHAEIDAILQAAAAGDRVSGGHVTVDYHYVCGDCQDFMMRKGITFELGGAA